MTEKASWREKGLFGLHFPALFSREGSQDRDSNKVASWRQDLMQRPWRETVYWVVAPGLLSMLSYGMQDHQPRKEVHSPWTGPSPLDH